MTKDVQNPSANWLAEAMLIFLGKGTNVKVRVRSIGSIGTYPNCDWMRSLALGVFVHSRHLVEHSVRAFAVWIDSVLDIAAVVRTCDVQHLQSFDHDLADMYVSIHLNTFVDIAMQYEKIHG